MPRVFIVLCLLLQAASAARLTVRVEPRWGDRPLVMDELSLATADQEGMSVSRLAMLLSHAELKRVDGSWIGARDWVALLDAGKRRLSFELPGIPAERFTALRFDLGLDEETDQSDPVQRAAGHPLHPDVCGLHWGWRGGYVFLAIEGRYPRSAGEAGGYSYHLAGQACRGTIEVPVELDLRGDLVLTLAFDVLADPRTARSADARIALVRILAQGAGVGGMVGGQLLDLAAEGRYPATVAGGTPDEGVIRIQSMKTGALILAATSMGAVLGGATPAERRAVENYARALGLAFQIRDDLLDVEGDVAAVGKATGKDAAAGKATFVSLHGIDGAKDYLNGVTQTAKEALRPFGSRAATLAALLDFNAIRKS